MSVFSMSGNKKTPPEWRGFNHLLGVATSKSLKEQQQRHYEVTEILSAVMPMEQAPSTKKKVRSLLLLLVRLRKRGEEFYGQWP